MASSVSPARSARVPVAPMNSAELIHPERGFRDRIGEAALLAHFLVEPRRQSAAAEDVVHDIGSHEVRIVAANAGAAERHHGLRHVERHERALRRLGGLDLGDRRQAGLGRQCAECLVQQLAERVGVDIADHGDAQAYPWRSRGRT